MANIKSQKKRIVTNEKSRQRNRACKSELKTAVRAAREAVAAGDATAAYAKALYACRLLDKAASKGIIHKNQAANRKSGIMNLVNTIVTDDVRAAYVKPEAKKQESNGNKKAARMYKTLLFTDTISRNGSYYKWRNFYESHWNCKKNRRPRTGRHTKRNPTDTADP